MQFFAHPVDGVVREIVQIPAEAVLAECFHQDFAAQLVPCDAAVQQGWTYDGHAFAAPPPPVAAPEQNQIRARAELDQADRTVIRCARKGVPVPADWDAYMDVLVGIVVAGIVPEAGWPTKPAYPPGS